MFIKSLIKSVATATVVGSVLAAAQVAVPAAETATAQSKSAAGGCVYPSRTQTTTRLTLRQTIAQYGTRNRAHVFVTNNSNTSATPRGRARLRIVGVGTFTNRLSGGEAVFTLPRRLSAGSTYRVRATYLPSNCSQFKPSRSELEFYTVVKATTRATPTVRDIPRGTRPRVHVGVTSATGIMVGAGRVGVRLFKGGVLKQRRVVDVRDGQALATFGRVFRRGIWDVKVVYRGTSNFRRDSASTWFRVTRR